LVTLGNFEWGVIVLTGQEAAEQRAARLAKKLRALGVDPNDIE